MSKNIKYYYFRDYDKKPRITVCIGKNEMTGKFNRGFAFCSLKDNPNKCFGRHLALSRMIDAIAEQKDNNEIKRNELWKVIYSCYEPPFISYEFYNNRRKYKSQYNVELTTFEKKLFGIEE